MLSKKVVQYVIIFIAVIVVVAIASGSTGSDLGLLSFLIGALSLGLAFIFALMRKYKEARTFFLMGGVLFLIGFGLCSAFPFNLNIQ